MLRTCALSHQASVRTVNERATPRFCSALSHAPSARSHPVRRCPGVANHQDPVTTSHLPHSNPGPVDRMVKENDMTLDNEQIIRQACKLGENEDLEGWAEAFTDDGTLFSRVTS